MGRAKETRHNKVQTTRMALKKWSSSTLVKKKKEKIGEGNSGMEILSGIDRKIDDLRVQVLAEKAGNPDCAIQSINAIDFISFWLCSTIFLLFNIAYWNYY